MVLQCCCMLQGRTTAKKAKKMEYAEFAKALMLHAQTEEKMAYPAAILIGEYVREKLRSR